MQNGPAGFPIMIIAQCDLMATNRLKPRIRYSILDDFGAVLRWQWEKPSKNYKFVTQRIERPPVIDWDNFEPALF